MWTLVLAMAALAVSAAGDDLQVLLQYDRESIAAGAFWRPISQHWTHWSASHLLWDVAVFLALGAVCERHDRTGFLAAVGGAAVLISASFVVLLPGLATCRGLSGVDSALFALAAATWTGLDRNAPGALATSPRRRWMGASAIALFLGKCLYEQVSGTALFVRADGAGMVPVPLAHLAGLLVGLGVAALRRPARASARPGRPSGPRLS